MAQDCYTHELKTRYATLMTAFPQLNDESLNALYDYIRNEDFKKGIDYNKTDDPCADSCRIYDSIYAEVNNLVLKRQNLINDNGHRINFDRNFPAVRLIV
jgi:hypothetical protein